MRRLLAIAAVMLALTACNDAKDQEKARLNEVMKVHDNVMGHEEKLMQYKMKLDTLLLTADSSTKPLMSAISVRLVKADSAMGNWMENFDPSQKSKTHEEIMSYLDAQKKQILAIDSQLTGAVKAADAYLQKIKK